MGVLATPIMCTTPGEIIQSTVSMMGGGNSSNGNSTILGELGIRQDMVDQELQEALNLVVCVPSMMNNTTEMGST
jgi:hypothetical protein